METLTRRFKPDARVLFDVVQLFMAIAVIASIAALRRMRLQIAAACKRLTAGPFLHGEGDYRQAP
jgi:hypothetical protein